MRSATQSGQVGLIIILMMVVLLTIGLSVASQSTQEVFLSNQEDESTRVFNAAEAGVEQALASDITGGQMTITGTATVPGSDANVNYTIRKLSTLTTRIPQGGTAMIKLADPGVAPTTSFIHVAWGKETDCAQKPATLMVEIVSYNAAATPKTSARYEVLSPCNYNDDNTIIHSSGANDYFRATNVTIGTNDTLMRIKPYYNDTMVDISALGGGSLPVQSYIISSTAVNQLGNNNETRSVEVNRTLSMAPSVLDYVVFSGTTLSQ